MLPTVLASRQTTGELEVADRVVVDVFVLFCVQIKTHFYMHVFVCLHMRVLMCVTGAES